MADETQVQYTYYNSKYTGAQIDDGIALANSLNTTVNDLNNTITGSAGLTKSVAALETAIGPVDNSSGIRKQIADLETQVSQLTPGSNENLGDRITALETIVGKTDEEPSDTLINKVENLTSRVDALVGAEDGESEIDTTLSDLSNKVEALESLKIKAASITGNGDSLTVESNITTYQAIPLTQFHTSYQKLATEETENEIAKSSLNGESIISSFEDGAACVGESGYYIISGGCYFNSIDTKRTIAGIFLGRDDFEDMTYDESTSGVYVSQLGKQPIRFVSAADVACIGSVSIPSKIVYLEAGDKIWLKVKNGGASSITVATNSHSTHVTLVKIG